MHKNAIKIVGGVKFSKKIPQNVGFFDQKVWDFWHWGGDKIVGFSASRGGFSPFNFWPHCWKFVVFSPRKVVKLLHDALTGSPKWGTSEEGLPSLAWSWRPWSKPMEAGLVIWATAFISIAAILWVVVAKLASNSEATATSSTQLDEVEVNTDDHMPSTQHAVVTSKFMDLKKSNLENHLHQFESDAVLCNHDGRNRL